jgi:hypothetical protein
MGDSINFLGSHLPRAQSKMGKGGEEFSKGKNEKV